MKYVIESPNFNTSYKEIYEKFRSISKTKADEIHIRDTTCKRRDLSLKDYKNIIRLLKKNNKKVILGTFPFECFEDKKIQPLERLVDYIEINHIGVLEQIKKDTRIISGPYLKLYNKKDISIFQEHNLQRIVLPYVITKQEFLKLSQEIPIQKELFSYGRVPISLGWDCFIAKNNKNNRVNCKKECMKPEEKFTIMSLDGKPLFRLLGPVVSSHHIYNITNELHKIGAPGYMRININHLQNTSEFHKRIDKYIKNIEKQKNMEEKNINCCNGIFYSKTPGYKFL